MVCGRVAGAADRTGAGCGRTLPDREMQWTSDMARLLVIWLCGLLLAFHVRVSVAAAPEFNRSIGPLLAQNCFECHGPDARRRQAGLRLDRERSAKSIRDGRAAIVAGDPSRSELVRRILSNDPDTVMPPPDSGHSLQPAQRRLLVEWIRGGAVWQDHWAFVPPVQPPPPTVRKHDWIRNPIDSFVLSRLEQQGLEPAPTAARETLIRRVTLDLTGLPPTPAEVAEFLRDGSPAAYDRLVDRLLDSPRYGEHMALAWLEAARYADTDGYQNDGPRSMWRWRDWVIDAYNAGMTFDRFTIEQLAGDLLPRSTREQKIATGFCRNHRYNSEAGLVLEEFLLENAVDRVDTVATVWMGLTLGCARCHDHKYDPFSQREYYQLIGLFDNVTESGRAVKFGNSEPWIVAPTPAQQLRADWHRERVRRGVRRLAEAAPRIQTAQAAWEQSAGTPEANQALVSRGLQHEFRFEQLDKRLRADGGPPVFVPGAVGRAVRLDGNRVLTLGKVGTVLCQRRNSVAFWLRTSHPQQGVVLSRQSANTRRPGLLVELVNGRLRFAIITRWVAGVGAVETLGTIPGDEWVHVALTNDGSQSARGMKIYLNGRPASTRIVYNTNSNTGGTPAGAVLRVGGGVQGARFRGAVDELRFYQRTLWDDEIRLLAIAGGVSDALRVPADRRTNAQQIQVRAWFLEHAAEGALRRIVDDWVAARQARQDHWDTLPTSMVMEQRVPRRPTFVRVRGVYHQHGPQVEPGVPAVLNSSRRTPAGDRLKFAEWLVDGRHPLTARVAVNRYWQRYFGTGLVKTAEDFGVQGEPPTHPALLDWLASEFVHSGWNVKQLQRLIVSSATYRQTSRVSERAWRRDPHNRLLARGTRPRLSAHAIRDQALAISGLLVERLGGPSVSPYQPRNLWRELSNMTYRQSRGDDLYRRSIYTIWKRTLAPPSLAILDAAGRETCSVRPSRTNTPLQALTLLNETAFVESARRLGTRMLLEGGSQPVEFAFRLVTSRGPSPEELELLKSARAEYLAEYRRHPGLARKLISVGASAKPRLDPVELAANTALANVLLNLDEVISRE